MYAKKYLLMLHEEANWTQRLSVSYTPSFSSLISLSCLLLQHCAFFQIVFILSQLVKCEQLVSFVIWFYTVVVQSDKELNCPTVTELVAKPISQT